MPFRVEVVPCLRDNYAYLVICEASGRAAIVDPGEAPPVLAAVERLGVTLAAVWATHHHPDHVGGVPGLPEGLEVVAHASDQQRVPRASRLVEDGGECEVGEVRARIIHNPGHTLGAISFVLDGAVFTGDTMFGGGCGRLFEGTAAQMHTSLQRLAALPPETRVYFGHEYTHANLRFAAELEPDNPAIAARAARPAPTTPSTIADERATNPFVRAADADALARIRKQKDVYK
jgi:hydroxyacylglutathione hydrolase